MSQNEDEQKKLIRMNIINKALDDGWSVKKSNIGSKTYEFTKDKSLDNDYKGLIIFSKSNISAIGQNICDDIQKHLENLKRTDERGCDKKIDKSKRSVSTPILKNN